MPRNARTGISLTSRRDECPQPPRRSLPCPVSTFRSRTSRSSPNASRYDATISAGPRCRGAPPFTWFRTAASSDPSGPPSAGRRSRPRGDGCRPRHIRGPDRVHGKQLRRARRRGCTRHRHGVEAVPCARFRSDPACTELPDHRRRPQSVQHGADEGAGIRVPQHRATARDESFAGGCAWTRPATG